MTWEKQMCPLASSDVLRAHVASTCYLLPRTTACLTQNYKLCFEGTLGLVNLLGSCYGAATLVEMSGYKSKEDSSHPRSRRSLGQLSCRGTVEGGRWG